MSVFGYAWEIETDRHAFIPGKRLISATMSLRRMPYLG